MENRMNIFVENFAKRARNIRRTTNLNKVGAANGLKLRVQRVANVEFSPRPQLELALVNTHGNRQAWLVIEPKIMKKTKKLYTYFTLGESRIQRKGYGQFLRALADKIGRDVGASGTLQWAVNIRKMGGKEPPSAGIMRKLGATPYKHHNQLREHGVHFHLPKGSSRANFILRKNFKLRIPNLPRTYRNQFNQLYNSNLLDTVMNKNNAHNFIINHVKNQNFVNALNRAKRRIQNKNISPKNLLNKYSNIFNQKMASVSRRVENLEKRRGVKSVSVRRPVNYSNL